jgi:ubiquinone/menaquinone biosynthesis C-methylase UbiE
MTLLSEAFPRTASEPLFLRGVGEYLPFRDHTFDAVLGLWMLNHVSRPEEVMREACRVLKPNGRLLLVLEDMPGDVYSRWGDNSEADSPCSVSAYNHDLQEDHIAISEQQLWHWTKGRVARIKREWIGGYLTIEFEKPPISPSE